MIPPYEEFRATSWEERIALFNAMAPPEKAELFRSQLSGWMDRNRQELTPEQTAVLAEALTLCTAEMYAQPRNPELEARFKDLEARAARVLSRAQIVDALTMQWGMSCRTGRPPG